MLGRDAGHDGESQAAAAGLGAGQAIETLQDAFAFLAGDARPLVTDAEQDAGVVVIELPFRQTCSSSPP